MRLARSIDIHPSQRRVHAGPVAGGTFWALDGLNDLPTDHRLAKADASYLILHGNLYVQDATRPGTWSPVRDVIFHRVVQDGSLVDGTFLVSVRPYLPELYYSPKTWRGRRAIRRAIQRATRLVRKVS